MQVKLYHRSYPAAGAPVFWSFKPDPASQHHSFTANGRTHKAVRRVVAVTVPTGSSFTMLQNELCWSDADVRVRSTALEVFDMATAGDRGFDVAVRAPGA
jgi:hypothetical protein